MTDGGLTKEIILRLLEDVGAIRADVAVTKTTSANLKASLEGFKDEMKETFERLPCPSTCKQQERIDALDRETRIIRKLPTKLGIAILGGLLFVAGVFVDHGVDKLLDRQPAQQQKQRP